MAGRNVNALMPDESIRPITQGRVSAVGKTLKDTASGAYAHPKRGPLMLTLEEYASLCESLTALPAQLSPEVKRAAANYRRVRAERKN